MKFELTLATVLVFLVPGGLLLFGTPVEYVATIDRWDIVHRPADITQAGMLLCLVFVAGTVLDMVRTITVQPVVTRIAGCRGAHMPSYFKHIDKDSLDIFMLINDKSNEYLRLNQNVALSLLIIFILQQAHHIRWQNLLYLALTVAWVVIAVRSRRDLIAALNGFVEAQERAETAEAAAAARLPRPFPRLLRP